MATIVPVSRQAASLPAAGRWERWLFITTMAMAGLFVVASTAFVAIERDEGLALAMGLAIRDGYLPYRDLFENRLPALHYLLSLLFRFAPSFWAARLLVLGVDLGGAWLASRLAQALDGRAASRWTILFYFFAILLFHGYWLVMEPFFAALLLLALWLYGVRGRPELAALATVASVWFKQTALPPALALLALLLWQATGGKQRLAILGVALLATVVPAVLFWRSNMLNPLLEQTVWTNFRTAGNRWPNLPELVKTLFQFVEAKGILWVLWAAGLFELLSMRQGLGPVRGRLAVALTAVTLAAWIVALPTPGIHYFLPTAALGSVAAGVVASRWLRALTQTRHRIALMALFIVPLLAGGAIPALSVLKKGTVFHQLDLGRRLGALTMPGEPVLVIHYSPTYYFLARRYPPVPTFFLYWINDTPEIEERMVQSLGREVRIAVVVDYSDSNLYGTRIRQAIRSQGRLLYEDPSIQAEIWEMKRAP